MRATMVALAVLALASSSGAARPAATRVAYTNGGRLTVVDLATGRHLTAAPASGAVAWSGDGRFLSTGGRVVGGPILPTRRLQWAPTGEAAAYQTNTGAVETWSPLEGQQTVVPARWGATSLAWGPNGTLALGRSAPGHQEVWIRRAGKLRRVAGPFDPESIPIVAGVDGAGRALWWRDPDHSASIAQDGLVLSANWTPLATTLVYPDFVVNCGRHLALVAGRDRFATHGKRILLDGRDVSRDRSRSWVSPACDGRRLVAAGGRNWQEREFGQEHRALWQLLPTRRQLTHPPAGWTDEAPHLLPDGSLLFVRTRLINGSRNGQWTVTTRGKIERLAGGRLHTVSDLTYAASESNPVDLVAFYGHYGWPSLIASSH